MASTSNLSAETACFQEELSESQWKACSDFEKEDRNQSLFCNACPAQGRRQSKPRRCPLTMCVYKDRELYLQEHEEIGIKIPLPDITSLGVPVSSLSCLEQVTPIARHRQEHYLLHFRITPDKLEPEQACYLFLAVNSEGGEFAFFTMEMQEFLDVLACARGIGCDPPLACLLSHHKEFHVSNVCHVEIYHHDCHGETSDSVYQVPQLIKTHIIPLFLSSPPHSILPMVLFHPLTDDKLVFFHLNSEQHVEFERVSEAWLSEYSLQAIPEYTKLNLLSVLEEMAATKPKFQNAEFSQMVHVLAVSFTLTDMSRRGLRSVAVILLNAYSYQSLKKIILPVQTLPEHVSLRSGNWIDPEKLVCFKSYTPVFSKCGQKMAVARCLGRKTSVYVYRIPVCISLQSQCRRVLRKHATKQGIQSLPLPPILRKYLEFS
ncbi:uncharacterized protein LOC135473512 [Liolophura sinensis]|uniref:uncharacterized protein LOC135473512 n=1 Tax=Liolophura sinensis TaxID=3198878 RepID=UPI003158DC72